MKNVAFLVGLFFGFLGLMNGQELRAGQNDLSFLTRMRPDQAKIDSKKHVHFMHLDGYRADLFKKLLEGGQLPHFEFLLSRGKISYSASTVDKSETMKVIESYLTSQRNSYITGWWEFNRNDFNFKNFWLDPAEVFNYELGLDFPVVPTIFDILARDKKNATAGFSLHRRGVSFENYTRNFAEGLKAVYDHSHYTQAHASMSKVLELYERIAKNEKESLPAFSTSLMAPADEFAHLKGVTLDHPEELVMFEDGFGEGKGANYCVTRKEKKEERAKDPYENIFQIIKKNEKNPKSGVVFSGKTLVERGSGSRFEYLPHQGHFTVANRREFCIHIPQIEVYKDASDSRKHSLGQLSTQYAHPEYVLGMIQVDIELGRLINTLREIRFDCKANQKKCFVEGAGNGIEKYAEAGKLENSLFENTLFIFSGDHGMGDTRHMMAKRTTELDSYGRSQDSIDGTFIDYLNHKLALESLDTKTASKPNAEIGVDDAQIPSQLSSPYQFKNWQSQEISELTDRAESFADDLFAGLASDIREGQYDKYWPLSWASCVKKKIDTQVESGLSSFQNRITRLFAQLYLRGEPTYVQAEKAGLLDFYNKNVRLVYGGAARNNAELFIPVIQKDGNYTWSQRPSFKEIMEYRGGKKSKMTLLQAVKSNPGVGLIFIRENNELYQDRKGTRIPQEKEMNILVMDRFDNQGRIKVIRDVPTGELLFGYQSLTPEDPLQYGSLGLEGDRFRTYNEWNDLSVTRKHYYHNAVAGMGAYLYSDSPAIGDISLMRSQGWNFGDNAGGHGGLHREEKLTVMMVSGPGVQRGELMAKRKFETRPQQGLSDSPYALEKGTRLSYPTVLDIAPTVLNWLGYEDESLVNFAKNGFEAYLTQWISNQEKEFPEHFIGVVNEMAKQERPDLRLDVSRRKSEVKRLFQYTGDELPDLPDPSDLHEEGSVLLLNQ